MAYNQLQKEKWEKDKHVETKQYATKESVLVKKSEEIRKYLETKNGNTTFQNL